MNTFLCCRNYTDKRSKWAEFNNILFLYEWLIEMERPAQIVTWAEIMGGKETVKPCILAELRNKARPIIAYYTQISSYKMIHTGEPRHVLIGENSNYYNAEKFTAEICRHGYV